MAVLLAGRILWCTGMVFWILPHFSLGSLSDYKICGDSECQSLMSRVQAIRDHHGKDCRFLSFRRGDTIFVYYKLAGKRGDLWAGSIDKQFGYFPKEAVQEEQVYATTEKVLETQKSDFFCMDEFGYPIDSSHLDGDTDDDQKNQKSETAHITPHPDDTSAESPSTPEEPPAESVVAAPVADETSAEEDKRKSAGDVAAGTQEGALETPATRMEQGGSDPSPSSWLGSSVTGWLGLAKEEEANEITETQAKVSVASSVTGWLGFGGEGKPDVKSTEQETENADSLASTMTGWLGFGGGTEKASEKEQDEEREDGEEPAERFRSRKMTLDLEGSQLHEEERKETGTLDWLGSGLSNTLGFGQTNQEPEHKATPEEEAKETIQEEEEQPASSSWLDMGIGDILGFRKDEKKVKERAGSGLKGTEEDKSLEHATGSENVDTSQPQSAEEVETETANESKVEEPPKDQNVPPEIQVNAEPNYNVIGTSDRSEDHVSPEDAASKVNREDIFLQTEFEKTSQTEGGMEEDNVSDDHKKEKSTEMKGKYHQMPKSIENEAEVNNREAGGVESETVSIKDQDFLTQSDINFVSDEPLPAHSVEANAYSSDSLAMIDSTETETPQGEIGQEGEAGNGSSRSTNKSTDRTEKASEEDRRTLSTSESTTQTENSADQDSASPHMQQVATQSVGDAHALKETVKETERHGDEYNLQPVQTKTIEFGTNFLNKSGLKTARDSGKETETKEVRSKEAEKQEKIEQLEGEVKQRDGKEIKTQAKQEAKEAKEVEKVKEIKEEGKQEEVRGVKEEVGKQEAVEEIEEEGKQEEVEEIKEEGKQENVEKLQEIGKLEEVGGINEEGKQEEEKEVKEEGKQEEVEEIKEEGKQENVEELQEIGKLEEVGGINEERKQEEEKEVKEERKPEEVEDISEVEKQEEVEKILEVEKPEEVEERKEERKPEIVKEIKEVGEKEEGKEIEEEGKPEKVEEIKEEGKQEEVEDILEVEKQEEVENILEVEKPEEVEEIKEEGKPEIVKEIKEVGEQEEGKEIEEEGKPEKVEEIKEEGKQEEVEDILEVEKQEEVENILEVEKPEEVEEIKEEGKPEIVKEIKEVGEQEEGKEIEEEGKPEKVEEIKEEGKQEEVEDILEVGKQEEVEDILEVGEQEKGKEIKEEGKPEEAEEIKEVRKQKEVEELKEEWKQQEIEEFKEVKQEDEEELKEAEEKAELKVVEGVKEEDTKKDEEKQAESYFEEEMENSLHFLPHSKKDSPKPESVNSSESVFSTSESRAKNPPMEKEEKEEEKVRGEMKEEEMENVESLMRNKEEEGTLKCPNDLCPQASEDRFVKDRDGNDPARMLSAIEEGAIETGKQNPVANNDQILADRVRASQSVPVEGVEKDKDGVQVEGVKEEKRDEGENNHWQHLSESTDPLSLGQTTELVDDQLDSSEGYNAELEDPETISNGVSSEKENEHARSDPKIVLEDTKGEEREEDFGTGEAMAVPVSSADLVQSPAVMSEQSPPSDGHSTGPREPRSRGAFGLFKSTFSFFGSPVTETEGSKESAPSLGSDTGDTATVHVALPPEQALGATTVLGQVDTQDLHTSPPVVETPSSTGGRSHPTESPVQTETLAPHYKNLLAHMSADEATVLLELFGRHKLQFLDYVLGNTGTATGDPDNDGSILMDIERLLAHHKEALVAPSARLADAPREDKKKTRALIALQKLEALLARVKKTLNTVGASCVGESCSTHGEGEETPAQEDPSEALDRTNTARDEWMGVGEEKDGRLSGGTAKERTTKDQERKEKGGKSSEGESMPPESASPQPLEGVMRRILYFAHQLAEDSATHVHAARERLAWLTVQGCGFSGKPSSRGPSS